MLSVLLSALALLISSGSNPPKTGAEIFIKMDSRVPVERLAAAVRPIGLVDSRRKGTTTYLVRLNPGVDPEKAKTQLERVPGVHALEPEEEPFDIQSVKSLDRKIAHLSEDEAEGRGQERTKVHPKDKLDYLKAYRYFIGQRAFPYDKVNWDSFEVGRRHASQMPKARIGGGPGGSRPMTTPQWSFVGPTNLSAPYETYYGLGAINGRVSAVAFDPTTSSTIYASGAQGGLWKSTDSGKTWTWLSSTWTQLAVNRIVIDPNNPKTIYVAKGDYHGYIAGGYGILKTTDGGTTWSEIAMAAMGKVGVASLLIDPTNSNILIAGTGDINTDGALYRSTDAGNSWTKLGISGALIVWPTLAASAVSAGTTRLYAVAGGTATTTYTNPTTRLFVSDDHGATWKPQASPVVPDGLFRWPIAIATSPTNPNNVYILGSDTQTLYASSDKGATWNDVSANLPTGNDIYPNYNFSQGYYDYHLECGSRTKGGVTVDVLYLGEIDLTESTDGGNTWVSVGGPTYESYAISHNDQHALAVCPTNPNLAIFGNDGGAYTVTYDPASDKNSVASLNQNLGNTMFYKIALHPTLADYLMGGTQDNSTPLSTGDITNWMNVGGGDGGGCAINQTNPKIQYTTSEYLWVYRTADGWATEQNISPTLESKDQAAFVAAMALCPTNQNLMFVGTNFLWEWNETTQTWTSHLGGQELNNSNSGAQISAIAFSPTDGNRIYTGAADGALWMSTTQGSTWTQLNTGSPLPVAALTSISVNPADENDIIIGFSSTGNGNSHLWRCSNTQAASPTFTNVSGIGVTGLPDVSLNVVVRDINNPASTWWVGTDVGVFMSNDSGSTWSNAGTIYGLPAVIVDDLAVNATTGYIVAGTYGRGMWRMKLTSSAGIKLTKFTVSPSSVTGGDSSTGTVTLSAAPGTGGVTVALNSSNTSVATAPASVTVPSGATSATFTISTYSGLSGQNTSTFTATYSGVGLTQVLTVNGITISSVSLSPTSVLGGLSSTGTVTIGSAAPAGGFSVPLSSSTASATVPGTVTVAAGATTATFNASTNPVSSTTVAVITAGSGSASASANLTITPPDLANLSLSPTSVSGGTTSTGTVTLTGDAPSSGTTVTLSSSNSAAMVPANVVVPSGQKTATFTVSTSAVSTTTSAVVTATVGSVKQTATLTITPPTLATLTVSPTSVTGGTSSTGMVTLSWPTGSTGLVVSLQSGNTSAVVPASVTVASGASTASFTITTSPVNAPTTATLTATLGANSTTASLTITPSTLSSVTLNPTTVIGGSSSTGLVTLTGKAGNGGTIVGLTSSSSAATLPTTVTVPAGSSTASFTVGTNAVGTSTQALITATIGAVQKSATITVNPATLTSFSVSPSTVVGGSNTTGSLTLNGSAPAGGASVGLTSNSVSATVPSSVTIAAGATSTTFTVSTSTVSATATATLTATLGTSMLSTSLTIQTPLLSSLSVSPSSVTGGTSSTGTVALTRVAPSGGVVVALSATGTGVSVPASASIAAGATSATFTVTTSGVSSTTTATVSASLSGTTRQTSLAVLAPALASISLLPTTVVGGKSATGTVAISGPAPASGLAVALSSGSTNATVPSSVTISAGATAATFNVATNVVSATTTATITAKVGTASLSTTLTIQPIMLSSIDVLPSSVVGGSKTTVSAQVALNGAATGTGVVVALKSSNPAVATVPTSVKIVAGAQSVIFPVTHKLVTASKTVTITATYAGVSQSATLSVVPFQVTGLTLNPTTVIGGTSISGTVTLNAQPGASGGVVVKLASNSKVVVTTGSVTVLVGNAGANFTLKTTAVASLTNGVVTATYGTSSKQATATVNPATLASFSVSPTTVQGKSTKVVTGTVILSGPAPSAGTVITLSSSNTGAASMPATVKIAAGQTKVTFTVSHKAVSSSTQVTLTAAGGGVSKTSGLTVTP